MQKYSFFFNADYSYTYVVENQRENKSLRKTLLTNCWRNCG